MMSTLGFIDAEGKAAAPVKLIRTFLQIADRHKSGIARTSKPKEEKTKMNNIKKNQNKTIEIVKPTKLRNMDFFISTQGGMTTAVTRELLLRNDIQSASRSLSKPKQH